MVRALAQREDSEVRELLESWAPTDTESEPAYEAPAGVPLVAAQMFGGTDHKVNVRYV